ncbi:MAG: glycosyltransferase family 1 protein, partial [Pseudomonadota bacterium]
MKAVFAIPGDRHRRTGGFIYESTVLDQLRMLGHDIEHMRLPDAYPGPQPDEVAETLRQLQTVPPHIPIILD